MAKSHRSMPFEKNEDSNYFLTPEKTQNFTKSFAKNFSLQLLIT